MNESVNKVLRYTPRPLPNPPPLREGIRRLPPSGGGWEEGGNARKLTLQTM